MSPYARLPDRQHGVPPGTGEVTAVFPVGRIRAEYVDRWIRAHYPGSRT